MIERTNVPGLQRYYAAVETNAQETLGMCQEKRVDFISFYLAQVLRIHYAASRYSIKLIPSSSHLSGYSAVGSALAWGARGRGFKSH